MQLWAHAESAQDMTHDVVADEHGAAPENGAIVRGSGASTEQVIDIRGTQDPPEHMSVEAQSALLVHSGGGGPPLSLGPLSGRVIPPSVPDGPPLSGLVVPESAPRGPPARERFRQPVPSAIEATITAAKTR